MQHPVSKELLVHIGDMTVSFAMLELYLQELMNVLLLDESPRIGHIVSSHLSFRSLRAVTISLYKERYGEDSRYSELKNLLHEAGDLEEERNLITHSIWGFGDDLASIKSIKIRAHQRHGLQFQSKDYDSTALSAFVTRIRGLAEKIALFGNNLRGGK
jgi:hypothetical protein